MRLTRFICNCRQCKTNSIPAPILLIAQKKLCRISAFVKICKLTQRQIMYIIMETLHFWQGYAHPACTITPLLGFPDWACALEPVPFNRPVRLWCRFSYYGVYREKLKMRWYYLQDPAVTKESADSGKAEQRRFLCPLCGKHTILWLLPTTEIKDLPVKCKRCGKETVVNIPPLSHPWLPFSVQAVPGA